QDVEKVGNLHAGIAIDEVQDAMMRAPEAEAGERLVGIADEIPVGEKQELDQVPDRLLQAAIGSRVDRGRVVAGNNYVSHVDIFGFDCYSGRAVHERIVRAQPGSHGLVLRASPNRVSVLGRTYRDLAGDAKSVSPGQDRRGANR